MIQHWTGGRDAALDVINPLQMASLVEAGTTPGYALKFAYKKKLRGSDEDCRRQSIALGGWHPGIKVKVRKLATALSCITGQEEGEALRHLWVRLGILLKHGNTAILGSWVPSYPAAYVN